MHAHAAQQRGAAPAGEDHLGVSGFGVRRDYRRLGLAARRHEPVGR
jgi:hypothetical protein